MKIRALCETEGQAPFIEAMWWIERWVSGSIRDPDWDESWITKIKTFSQAVKYLKKENPPKGGGIYYRYLAVSEETYRNLSDSKKYDTNGKIQSFTVDLETARTIANDLNVSGKHQIIIACNVPASDVYLDIGQMFKDKKFKNYMVALQDWKDQKEVLIKSTKPLDIIEIFTEEQSPLTEDVDLWDFEDAAISRLMNEIDGGVYDYIISDNELDDDDELTDEMIREYAANQVDDAIGRLRNFSKGDKLEAWRVVSVPEDFDVKLLKTKHPGIYWSWDEDAAEAHWGGQNGTYDIRIHAEIPHSSIDWVSTIAMNANPAYEDEREIRIKENAPVKILGIEKTKHRR